ncbi:MAG: cell wall-binding repeat-containing protein [Buchananella hordeovulneris]|nr:cell wall-binding repeat-containing protein [Buchananella hordeovulneris]
MSKRRGSVAGAKVALMTGAVLALGLSLTVPAALADEPAPAPSAGAVDDAPASPAHAATDGAEAGDGPGGSEPPAANPSEQPGGNSGGDDQGGAQPSSPALPSPSASQDSAGREPGQGSAAPAAPGAATHGAGTPGTAPGNSSAPGPSSGQQAPLYPSSEQDPGAGLVLPTSTFGYKPNFAFDKNLLITDSLFFNGGDMTIPEIRAFLAEKGKSCKSTPFGVCLKDYKITTYSEPASAACPVPYRGVKNEDVASILYHTSLSCNVSVKALLVTLEKEQGLVTAANPPAPWRYKTAMGFGCPDGAPCDSQYHGLANQLFLAAQQFQIYRLRPHKFNFAKGRESSIDYQALDKSCGSTKVTPRSAATAGLYNYTPYTPNRAALAVGSWQTGDRCSTYGNRNFVYFYDEWFGDPRQEAKDKPLLPPGPGVKTARAGGTDRFNTSLAVSAAAYPKPGVATTAYVTRGDVVADALVAGSMTDGPVLLAPAGVNKPSRELVAEIKRLGVRNVVLVGGEQGLTGEFEQKLAAATGKTVMRASGEDRIETAVSLSRLRFAGKASTVYLADAFGPTGEGSPDAVAGAVLVDGPVLLVPNAGDKRELIEREIIRVGAKKVVALGGQSAIPDKVLAYYASGRASIRLAGDSRFSTAVAIATYAVGTLRIPAETAYLVNNNSLVDAVVAGSYSRGPILLTHGQALSGDTGAYLKKLKPGTVTGVGGVSAVSDITLAWAAYFAK